MTTEHFLPYAKPALEPEDIEAVVQVLQGEWLSGGPAVTAFEDALAASVGSAFAAVCSSGTAGLHLALLALDIGSGDAVLVPAITFAATANVVRHVGAEVVFVDVDPTTGLITTETMLEGIARAQARGLRPRAVMPVHYAGQVANIMVAARALDMVIIEDACHAFGSVSMSEAGRYPVGACRTADCTVFSFHPLKTITTGEGGAVTCNDAKVAARIRTLRNHGVDRSVPVGVSATSNTEHVATGEIGFNYRLSDIHCALGRSQLARLPVLIERRKSLVDYYHDALRDAPLTLLRRQGTSDPAWHLFVVLIDFELLGVTRDKVRTALGRMGIGTQIHYVPVYRLPYYRTRYGELRLAGSEWFFERALSLPLYASMTRADVDTVVTGLQACLQSQEATKIGHTRQITVG